MRASERWGAFALSAKRIVRLMWRGLVFLAAGLIISFALIIFAGNVLFSAPRDIAHRSGHPYSKTCRDQPNGGWGVFADASVRNDEYKAIAQDEQWAARLKCVIQTHSIPVPTPGAGEPAYLKYHIAFLEFQEDGNPQAIGRADQAVPSGGTVIRSQLDALLQHLESRNSNYVVAFAHGWRHDASMGDGNVADLRHYAAHAARFVSDRRRSEGRLLETEVTAVYIGWPGARVDETRLNRAFEFVGLRRLGEWLTSAAAVFTLFDRKPISEQVAPYALSSLRQVAELLTKRKFAAPTHEQKMIVFGHSLGGNMLMTALGDHLAKQIHSHVPGTAMSSPLGDLVVLINPASEAGKWIALQREIWKIAPSRPFEGSQTQIEAGHRLFPIQQRPVLVSVTAARYWPPGGVRSEDCMAALESGVLKRRLDTVAREEARGLQYDLPTHDLFPAFRFDFRPVADSMTRWARRIESPGERKACEASPHSGLRSWLMMPVFWFADRLRYFPFINTDHEQTRTIGHFEAPRAAFGNLLLSSSSEKPFGTTHELAGLSPAGSEVPIEYRSTPYNAKAACPSVTSWLYAARRINSPYGTRWDTRNLDSKNLSKIGMQSVNKPAAQFVHGYVSTGRLPITRANDPLWNIRAYDNALAKHNGYALSSFICAMQQLVLDDITYVPPV